MGPARAWAAAAGLCWLVALLLAAVPVSPDYPGGAPRNLGCPNPVEGAFAPASPESQFCAAPSRRRVGRLAIWLVLTGGVSTGFVGACALSRRREAA